MTLRPIIRIPGITELPPSAAGMRIGLFGGSFNPVHEGHRLVAEQTMRKLELDALWMLVTPGNPLKNHAELAPLETRVRATRAMMAGNPAIRVTGFEAAHGFSYSWQTIRFLTQSLKDRRFVWIMGADNMVHFHRWERWRDIAAMLPIAVYVRPGSPRAPAARAAAALSRYRIDEVDAARLASLRAPAWVYLHGLMSPLSSSAIRAKSPK